MDLEFAWPDIRHRRILYESDPFFEEIPLDIRESVFLESIRVATETALRYLERYDDLGEIYDNKNLIIREFDADRVIGNTRYFSEYTSGQNTVTLYLESINKWASFNGVSFSFARELFLAHELYHYLECNEIGLTSRLVKLPLIKIGPFKFGSKGIRALCEVGAETFSACWMGIEEKEGNAKDEKPL